MKKTILVCGYGPGISDAVARKFGAEGFQVALVARGKDKVDRGAAALKEAGITAKGFSCDLGDTAAVKRLVGEVRASLGPITVLHWNAYVGLAGDLLTADVQDLRKVFDVGIHGLVTAVQESLPDLKEQKGSVLVTGGGFSLYDEQVDQMVVQFNAMGLALTKAAQHKLVGVLNKKLASQGVYVGEVVVLSIVKGTAFDAGGHGTLEASTVASRFWDMHQKRTEVSTLVK
ncbi:MAG: SDR family NAD(P)-dependent oxidoreductase [Myxococcota bacterium]